MARMMGYSINSLLGLSVWSALAISAFRYGVASGYVTGQGGVVTLVRRITHSSPVKSGLSAFTDRGYRGYHQRQVIRRNLAWIVLV